MRKVKLPGVASLLRRALRARGCRFAAVGKTASGKGKGGAGPRSPVIIGAFTKSIAYKLSRDFSFSSFPGA